MLKIICPNCRKHIYNLKKDKAGDRGLFDATDLAPANDKIPQPYNDCGEGKELLCPLCGGGLIKPGTFPGGVILLTPEGWIP